MTMKARMDFRKASPQGAKAMGELHAFVHRCGLDHTLLELVKLRASAFRTVPGSYRVKVQQAAE